MGRIARIGERGSPSYRPEKRRGGWYAGVMLA